MFRAGLSSCFWTLSCAWLILAVASPTEAQTLFADALKHDPVAICPDGVNDYSQIVDCANRLAPPEPSIQRSVSSPHEAFTPPKTVDPGVGSTLPVDRATVTWPIGTPAPWASHIFPFQRSTFDGRLALGGSGTGDLQLRAFRPELLDYDDLSITPGANPSSPPGVAWDWSLHHPAQTRLRFRGLGTDSKYRPATEQQTICSSGDSSIHSLNDPNPYVCTADGGGTTLEGECYDVTLLTSFQQDLPEPIGIPCSGVACLPLGCSPTSAGACRIPCSTDSQCPGGSLCTTGLCAPICDDDNPCSAGLQCAKEERNGTMIEACGRPSQRWELRSMPVTVFVAHAKTPQAGDPIWVYPRQSTASLPEIGHYSPVPVQGGTNGRHLDEIFHSECGPNAAPWCEFPNSQSSSAAGIVLDENRNGVEDPGELWHGRVGTCIGCAEMALFEPVTTSDGMMLIVNGSDSLWYSINDIGPCRADGFRVFRRLSHLPNDPVARQRYDFAKAALTVNVPVPGYPGGKPIRMFRDSQGELIPPWAPFHGAYPWIDRAGKNLVFARVNDFRDAWQASQQIPSQHREGEHLDLLPDARSGKGVSVVGAWTQGKIVHMDNGMNPTDWGGGQGDWVNGVGLPPIQYTMDLYQGAPMTIRPKPSSLLNSVENELNYLDPTSPMLPFDVVWRLTSINQHNAEIAFDEYLQNNVLVMAHMNAPHHLVGSGSKERPMPRDGFDPYFPQQELRYGGYPAFTFRTSPRLQNSAASSRAFHPNAVTPPSTLRLLGGARVEPVALGGVQGKGVYLDGANDHIDTGFLNPGRRNWYVSAWFDSREDDPKKVQTLFYWPDGSWIGMSRERLVAYNNSPNAKDRILELDIGSYGVRKGRFLHVGFKIFDDEYARIVSVYFNGTKLRRSVAGGLSRQGEMRFATQDAGSRAGGFAMNVNYMNGWSWFVAGDPGPEFVSPSYGPRRTFKGWIDELRIHALDSQQISRGGWFEEYICNTALGTLRKITPQTSGPEPIDDIVALARKAVDVGYGKSAEAVLEMAASHPVHEDDLELEAYIRMENGQSRGNERPFTQHPEAYAATQTALVRRVPRDILQPSEPEPAVYEALDPAAEDALREILAEQKYLDSENEKLWASYRWLAPKQIASGEWLEPLPDDHEPQEVPPPYVASDATGGVGSFGGVAKRQAAAPPALAGDYVIVCEQMRVGGGSAAVDFAPQRRKSACIDRVHRNQDLDPEIAATCHRRIAFQIQHKQIDAYLPRPEFGKTPFCQSCHYDQAVVPGLRNSALHEIPNLPRYQDARRQPLDHPAVLFGCTVPDDPFPLSGNCDDTQHLLDPIFDHGRKVEPPP